MKKGDDLIRITQRRHPWPSKDKNSLQPKACGRQEPLERSDATIRVAWEEFNRMPGQTM
jgi:hypothetical protein